MPNENFPAEKVTKKYRNAFQFKKRRLIMYDLVKQQLIPLLLWETSPIASQIQPLFLVLLEFIHDLVDLIPHIFYVAIWSVILDVVSWDSEGPKSAADLSHAEENGNGIPEQEQGKLKSDLVI